MSKPASETTMLMLTVLGPIRKGDICERFGYSGLVKSGRPENRGAEFRALRDFERGDLVLIPDDGHGTGQELASYRWPDVTFEVRDYYPSGVFVIIPQKPSIVVNIGNIT